MKFTQRKVATITLGHTIAIGEFEGHVTNAKPGNYTVYTVQRKVEPGETALLFIHEDEVQNINKLAPFLDIDVCCGVDAGTYGIVTKPENAVYHEWSDRWFDNEGHTDGYVADTNYGDGVFALYTNETHSVFLLDDEDIYLTELLADKGLNKDDIEPVSGYSFEDTEIEVDYYVPTPDNPKILQLNTLKQPTDTSLRIIDNIINTVVDAVRLASDNH